MERLDKTVAMFGNIPRSEAVKRIRRGEVTVDGAVCRDPASKWDPAAHTIALGGRVIDSSLHRYFMLNKPRGILCVSRDPKAPTVVDLLPADWRRRGIFPAGRLDKDTVGLVILTDDGDYAHRLLSPKKAVFKRYLAVVEGQMPKEAVAAFAAGTTLADGTRCLPAKLTILGEEAFLQAALPKSPEMAVFLGKYTMPPVTSFSFVEIAIQEGRYHQIKRMCESQNHKVLWLKRLSVGELHLDADLEEGQCRELSAAETAAALQSVEVVCAT